MMADFERLCVCCLGQTTIFYGLSKCVHIKGLFGGLISLQESKYPLSVVCCICHEKIKKVVQFQKQVEEATRMLNTMSKEQLKTVPKKHQYSISSISNINLHPEEMTEEIKAEHCDTESIEYFETTHDIELGIDKIDVTLDDHYDDKCNNYKIEDDEDDKHNIDKIDNDEDDKHNIDKIDNENYDRNSPQNNENDDTQDIEVSNMEATKDAKIDITEENYINCDSVDDFEWPLEKTNDTAKNNTASTLENHQSKNEKFCNLKRDVTKVHDMTSDKRDAVKVETKDRDASNHTDNDKEYKMLTMTAAKLFTKIWHSVKKANGDYYELMEEFYRLSINGGNKVSQSNKEAPNEKLILKYMSLYQQLTNYSNIEVKYLSVREQLELMNEKRKSVEKDEQYCQLCCSRYVHADTKERHITQNHNPKWPFECSVCRYRYKEERYLVQHLFRSHCVHKKCRECGIVSQEISFLREHWRWHSGQQMRVCQYCGNKYTCHKKLYTHLLNSHRSQIDGAGCELCGANFNGASGLRVHVVRYHPMAVRCKSCGVWFSTADAHTNHLRDDTCNPLYSACPVCGTSFTSKQLMQEHYETHQVSQAHKKLVKEKKKYWNNYAENVRKTKNSNSSQTKGKTYWRHLVCEVCGKEGFPSVSVLKIHQRLHTGEKPYQCDVCNKPFRWRPSLWTHMKIHTGERNHRCTICDKTFRQQSHLAAHIPTHTNEKAHQCRLCEKRFMHRSNMLAHVRSVHEGLPPRKRKQRKQ